MPPKMAYAAAISEIESDLIRLRTHLDYAKSFNFCPATIAKLEASMAKVGMCARRIYTVALDAQVECGIAAGEFEKGDEE